MRNNGLLFSTHRATF